MTENPENPGNTENTENTKTEFEELRFVYLIVIIVTIANAWLIVHTDMPSWAQFTIAIINVIIDLAAGAILGITYSNHVQVRRRLRRLESE